MNELALQVKWKKNIIKFKKWWNTKRKEVTIVIVYPPKKNLSSFVFLECLIEKSDNFTSP